MLYRFNACVLDLVRGSLHLDGHESTLRPKSFELLRYLVENPARLIPKQEFVKAVWPNTTVADESLTNCITEVRRAIGDRDQTIVKTVPRRGYIFTAEVTAQESVGDRVGSAAAPEPALPEKPSIAVLAFINMSGDPSQEYFSDGITEDIITELSRFSELLVIARNSTFTYKGRAVDVRRVGRELGVR
jgi:DNA-binding winged helix-turn-helix (wHTH) protein